ncbi:hypothetical protein AMTR_s00010p00122680 [Amborella trichopoda]|uniref:Homeobox domain-containing protein n=2 Tax=Amborella trichopoda TaxID=13333 RepID=W1NF48_AMBTC|nr:hypothetical protein AMTR_s00010p00122680 [Amborella trichopoda]
MGCSDSSSLNMSESSSSYSSGTVRRLRPLIPKPHLFPNASSSTSSPSCSTFLGHSQGDKYFTHNLPGGSDQGRRDAGAQPTSSRWNPTPEQLRTLEEMYRRGTRTPTADQIQYITGQLRRYGKIEGKNVFYWFQNHKARERQKRRRRIEAAMELGSCICREFESQDKKEQDSFGRRWGGLELSKNWAPAPTSCCTMRTTEGGGLEREEEWVQLPTFTITGNTTAPKFQSTYAELFGERNASQRSGFDVREDREGEVETLQLFPLTSDSVIQAKSNAATIAPNQQSPCNFFEFLPLKN